MQKITLKHIAKKFGISVSTVSKSLNDSYEISEATKKKVRDYADKMGYTPNSIAVSLLKQKTNTIGIIVPNINSHFYAGFITEIEKYLAKLNYKLLICLSDNSPEKEKQQIEMLSNGSIDGMIVAVTFKTSQQKIFGAINHIIKQELPIVLIDRSRNTLKCDKIILNAYQEIAEATDYLIQTNCKNIALVSDYSALHSKALCVKSFNKALAKGHIKPIENAVFDINDERFEQNITAHCLNTKLDGIVCLSEGAIIKTVLILNELNLKIPNKVSVIGITNSSIPAHFNPPITTIGHLGAKIAETVCSVLLNRIAPSENNSEFAILSPKCTIVQRKSTKRLYN